jgi:DNA-binding LytR/AlgR family response regulator
MIYSVWFIRFNLTFTNVIIFQGFTLAVGVIPITALILIKQNYLSRRNRERAELITSALPGRGADDNMDQQIRISSDNEKEYVVMKVQDFLFIKSDGNYITVGYLKSGKILTALLRNTLKYAEDLLASFRFIYKCHRSWLVNLNKVSKVRGIRLSLILPFITKLAH